MIDLKRNINIKEIYENENPENVVKIVGKTLELNKQRKGKRIKISTPKEMLQRLLITLAQVSIQKTYTKKVYNNIMNSINL